MPGSSRRSSAWEHGEFVQFGALDDFDCPAPCACGSQCGVRPLVTSIGKDTQYEGPHGARSFVKHERRAVAILNVGGMNGNAQQEAERVDQDMPLAAGDFLARLIALRVKQSPPFGAALALWL